MAKTKMKLLHCQAMHNHVNVLVVHVVVIIIISMKMSQNEQAYVIMSEFQRQKLYTR